MQPLCRHALLFTFVMHFKDAVKRVGPHIRLHSVGLKCCGSISKLCCCWKKKFTFLPLSPSIFKYAAKHKYVRFNQIHFCFVILKVKSLVKSFKIFGRGGEMTDGSAAFTKIFQSLTLLAEHFSCFEEKQPCQTHKRSNNPLASTDLARCHPRVQSHASKGDGPSAVRTGLWSGLCRSSCFLSFLSPPVPPWREFHTSSNAITLFDRVSIEDEECTHHANPL